MRGKLIWILLVFVAISGCSKAKNGKWLVGSVELINSHSNKHVTANIYLIYHESGKIYGDEEYDTLLLGEASNGFLDYEYELPVKIGSSSYLVAKSDDYYYQPSPGASFVNWSNVEWVSTKSENQTTLQISPIYHMQISLHNINYQNDNDSIFIWYMNPDTKQYEQQSYGGYQDSVAMSLPTWYRSAVFDFQITVKRDGQNQTSLGLNYDLQEGIINTYTIEY